MSTEFHPAALHELIDSARYYESRLPGLAIDFKSHDLWTVRRKLGKPKVKSLVSRKAA